MEALATAAELRARCRPLELVVLEVDLPDASGYELCRELHEAHGDDLPVIFVAEHRTEAPIGSPASCRRRRLPREAVRPRRAARARPPLPPSFRRGAAQAPVLGATSLTHREQEVLTLLAAGRTQKEIGTDLVISPKTVGTHIQRILAKLGVHSRAQAVVLALREGLVTKGDAGG